MNNRHLVGADLNLLLVFDAIWRERSITKAAAWLRVTQPAVSHALGRLRILADDPLFVKGGAGVVPTPRAEAMAANVGASLDAALAALQAPFGFDPATAESTVRLGLTDYATTVILPPVLRRIRKDAPGIEIIGVAIDTREPLTDLDNELVDLAFGPIDSVPERFSSEPIQEDKLVCLAANTGDLPDTMSLEFYLSRPHLVISYTGDSHSWTDDELAAEGKKREIGLVLPHGLAVGDALRGTDLITTVVESVARRIAKETGARIYSHPIKQRSLTTKQIWHRRLDADPLHRWFRQIVKSAQFDRTED